MQHLECNEFMGKYCAAQLQGILLFDRSCSSFYQLSYLYKSVGTPNENQKEISFNKPVQ